MLALWGSRRLCTYWPVILQRYLPRLNAWLFPTVPAAYTGDTAINSIYLWSGFVGDTIWAVVLCVLAVRVVRGRLFLRRTVVPESKPANPQRLDGLLWMIAGCVLAGLGFQDLYSCFVILPVHWVLPSLGSSPLLQHLLGFVMASLHLALWATPLWACWLFTVRYPQFGDRVRRVFKHRPIWTSVGLTLLVNSSGILALVYQWAGLQVKTPARNLGPIILEWNFGYWTGLCQQAALAVMLVILVQWRMRLREAESPRQRVADS